MLHQESLTKRFLKALNILLNNLKHLNLTTHMQCQFVIHEQGTPLYSTLGCAVCCGRIERTHLMFNKLALSVSPQLAISGYILNSYYLSKILHTVCV